MYLFHDNVDEWNKLQENQKFKFKTFQRETSAAAAHTRNVKVLLYALQESYRTQTI